MIGYCLQHEKIWISDFKPANWLYLDATESSNQYFHYRYRNKNDTYMDIYVRCTGELWLRSDFGNAINFKNFKNRVSFSKSSIKDTWKMYDDIMIREPGPSKVPYYIEKMEQQAAMKEPLPFDQMRITFDFIQRIKKQEDDNRQDWLAYTAIHRIRSEEPIKQIYNHLVEAFSDITKLNNQGVFGESLLIERPSEELIINKTPYQLNY